MVRVIRTTSAERRAHREAVRESTQSMTAFLVELLGARLTARIAGVDVSTVNRWKGDGNSPQPAAEERLRAASHVARLILAVDADHTTRAWFIGMNPQLDDEAPADALAAGDFKAVLGAARTFVDSA